MNKKVDLEKFVDKYSDLYFSESEIKERPKNLKGSDKGSEEKIMKCLQKGEVNVSVVAWKAGRLNKSGKAIKNEQGNYLNGYGREIVAEDLEDYLKKFNAEKKKK